LKEECSDLSQPYDDVGFWTGLIWLIVHDKFNENPSSDSRFIKFIATDITGEKVRLGLAYLSESA
jgi:hypothetical protein